MRKLLSGAGVTLTSGELQQLEQWNSWYHDALNGASVRIL